MDARARAMISLMGQLPGGEDEVRRVVLGGGTDPSLFKYRDDPVGFGEQVLGNCYTEDIKEVMRSVRDNVATIAKSANAVGKTHGAARIALWFYMMWPDAQVYTTAAPPERNLKTLLWGEIGSVLAKQQHLFSDHGQRTMYVERSPKSFITGVSIPTSGTAAQREAKFSGKHAPHILFIVDEGDGVPDEVYRGIEGCMSGGHARLLVMFNPRAQVGPVWIKERDGLANVVQLSALDHPNVTSGENQIPGAVTRETVVRRINQWSRPLASEERKDENCFEVADFLVGCAAVGLDGEEYPPLPAGWRKATDPAIWYMVLGEYPAGSEHQLINRAWVSAARSRYDLYIAQFGERPPEGVAPLMGQDVAELGADSNAVALRYGGWVAPFITWAGVDADMSADRGYDIARDRYASEVYVDGTGVGAGIAPKMSRKGIRARSVKVASRPTWRTEQGEFAQLRDQLWWACREWLRTDPGAMLPPDEKLIEELTAPSYAVKNGKIKVMDKKTMRGLLKRSPDRADALCLTFVGERMQATSALSADDRAGLTQSSRWSSWGGDSDLRGGRWRHSKG